MFSLQSSDGKTFSVSKEDFNQIMIRFDNMKYQVRRHYEWDNLGENIKITFIKDRHNVIKCESSAEHIVIFAMAITESDRRFEIIIKFRLLFNMDGKEIVYKMNADHMNQVIDNYNYLASHLENNQNQYANVRLNWVALIENRLGSFWIEIRINNFTKFWLNTPIKSLAIANANHQTLIKLQDDIYHQSGKTRTIVDLQGGWVNDACCLTDIEYTDTMENLGWKEATLMNAFLRTYNQRNKSWCTIQ